MAVKGRLLPVPNLDDRDWQEIKESMIKKIPDRCPEWTDWNVSDPGITLIEIFSLAIEELNYRLNQVLPKHMMEYLNMIGVTLTPPSVAQTMLYFKLSAGQTFDVKINKGFEIAAAESGEEPIVFTTDNDLIIYEAKLARCFGFQLDKFTDYTEQANDDVQSFNPIPELNKDNAQMLICCHENNYFQKIKIIIDRAIRPIEGVWDYLSVLPDGSHKWIELAVEDGTENLTKTGEITFDLPSDWSAGKVNGQIGTWIRFRLTDFNIKIKFPTIKKIEIDNIFGRVSVSNAKMIDEEILGSGTGLSDQKVYLNNVPVLDISIHIDNGLGFEAWEEVDDFLTSKPEDQHYLLNYGTGEITFGDGQRGRVPALGINNIKAMPYRYGGGVRGNVNAMTITQLRSSHVYIDSCFNFEEARGGGDEETINQGLERGPTEQLKTRNRAVTSEDFETLALESSTALARALALPLFNPANPEQDLPGAVSIIIMPKEGKLISQTLRDSVRAYLNHRRLVTAELYIIDPEYQTIDIDATIEQQENVNAASLETKIKETLKEYFHPEFGGVPEQAVAYIEGTIKERGSGWPFGRNVYLSELYELLERIKGVDHVTTISNPISNIEIAKNQLPVINNIVINIV